MWLGDLLGAFQISNRSCDSPYLVVRAGAQAQLVHRLLHEKKATITQLTMLLELLAVHGGVGGFAFETLALSLPGANYLLAHGCAVRAGALARQLAVGHRGD